MKAMTKGFLLRGSSPTGHGGVGDENSGTRVPPSQHMGKEENDMLSPGQPNWNSMYCTVMYWNSMYCLFPKVEKNNDEVCKRMF